MPSSSQHLFENNHLSRGQWFLIQVNGGGGGGGGGSGMRDPTYGYPIGPICLMPAMAVLWGGGGGEWNERSNIWIPYWTDLPDASHGCSVLLHCGCSVACQGNCRCHRAGIRCSRGCTNNDMDIWLWWLLELSKSYQTYNSFMLCYCCLQYIMIFLSWCKWSFVLSNASCQTIQFQR